VTAVHPLRSPQSNSRTLQTTALRLQLMGSNQSAKAVGVDPLPGKSNYFVGNNSAKWHTDVPTYAKVRYRDVYPGIDLLYYGNQEGKLEHDFVLAPGADPNLIAIGLRESARPVADKNGDLTLHTKSGDLTLRSPVVYQVTAGHREIIPATYVLASNNQIKFHLGSYDKTASLVIDPVLQYSGVFGGSGDETVERIAVDASGNAYITGYTNSTDFPLVNPLQGFGVNVHVDDTLPSGTTFVSDSAGGGTCTAPAVGATGSLHCVLPQLNKGQTYTVNLTVHVNAVAGTTLSNTATTNSCMQDLVPANNKGTLTTKVN
jgi:Domain of unknown function DUF11/Beta-propeller repeat